MGWKMSRCCAYPHVCFMSMERYWVSFLTVDTQNVSVNAVQPRDPPEQQVKRASQGGYRRQHWNLPFCNT